MCLLQAAKQLLAENNTPTAALVGRYVATYNHIRKVHTQDFLVT